MPLKITNNIQIGPVSKINLSHWAISRLSALIVRPEVHRCEFTELLLRIRNRVKQCKISSNSKLSEIDASWISKINRAVAAFQKPEDKFGDAESFGVLNFRANSPDFAWFDFAAIARASVHHHPQLFLF